MKGSAITGPVAKECVCTFLSKLHYIFSPLLLFFDAFLLLSNDSDCLLQQADLWPRIASNAGTVV
jgi:hypothetical protein